MCMNIHYNNAAYLITYVAANSLVYINSVMYQIVVLITPRFCKTKLAEKVLCEITMFLFSTNRIIKKKPFKTELNLEKCAFSIAACKTWVQLCVMLISYETISTFCKNLKTYFF